MLRILVVFIATIATLVPALLDAATVTVPGDHPTIQQAVDAAWPGEEVLVGKGEYSENVVVEKSVTLKAAEGARIKAADPGEPVITVSGVDGYVVSGFEVTDSKASGIRVSDSSNGRIEGNKAVNNANGILVYRSENNVITGNTADGNDIYGLYLERSHNNTVTSNNVDRNADRGIFLSYSNNNTVTGNSANLNAWNGITLWESDNNVIRNNLALRNTYGIVTGSSEGNEISGNVTLPNLYIILPVILVYAGIVLYLLQKVILRFIYGSKE